MSENLKDTVLIKKHPIFREEVFRHKKKKLTGNVIIIQPMSFSLITFLLVLFFLCIIAVLFNNDYAKKESVRGYIVYKDREGGFLSPGLATIKELYVAEGDSVKNGQMLAYLVNDFMSENQERINIIDRQIEDLRKEKSEYTKLFKERSNELEKIVYNIEDKLNKLSVNKGGFASSQSGDYVTHDSKPNEVITDIDLKAIELKHKLSMFIFENKKWALENAKIKKNIEIEIENKLSEITRFKKLNRFYIYADTAGTVTSIKKKPGETITKGQELLTVVPNLEHLQVELFVPSRAIGFLEVGMPVKVRLDAFPYQRFGVINGQISRLSRSIMTPSEIRKLDIPISINEPSYRAVVSIDKTSITAYGKQYKVKTGMLLSAEVEIEKRSLWQWLMDPIYSKTGKV